MESSSQARRRSKPNTCQHTKLADVPNASTKQVDRAVQAANCASEEWHEHGLAERRERANALADAIEDAQEDLANLDVADDGSTITKMSDDAGKAADTIRYFAGLAPENQPYEQRDGHRAAAIGPDVGAREPLDELVGSIVVGPGVADLEDELYTALRSPRELHEDAPEIAVRLPVRTTASWSVIATAVGRICDRKRLRTTREVVSLFEGSVAMSYDIDRAMYRGLNTEDRHREIHVNEVVEHSPTLILIDCSRPLVVQDLEEFFTLVLEQPRYQEHLGVGSQLILWPEN